VSETGVSFLPADLIGAFVASLLSEGFTETDLDLMMKTNPAKLLGLPVQ
jgi:predicted metal-dependent phosphotriesterase family hydrolase